MTTGDFEQERKELPEDIFRTEDVSPEILDGLKHAPLETNFLVLGSPGNYSFVGLTTDEEAREALKPCLAGPEMLDILAGINQPWGDADIQIDLGVLDGGQEDQGDTPSDYELKPYLTKSDMSVADVRAAIERIVRPPETEL